MTIALTLAVTIGNASQGDEPAEKSEWETDKFQSSFPIQWPVTTLEASPARSPDASSMAATPLQATPTLPDVKFPNYRLGHRQPTAANSEHSDGVVRMQLQIGRSKLIVEATITIDATPFTIARESRVQRLVQLASEQPATDERDLQTIIGYTKAVAEPIDIDQVRWILNHWIDGPPLLVVNDHYQKFRAQAKPAFDALDRNVDGAISDVEIATAAESFRLCDTNRDEIVDAMELETASSDPRRDALKSPLDESETVFDQPLLRMIQDENSTPDLELQIAFDTSNPAESVIRLTRVVSNPRIHVRVSAATGSSNANGVAIEVDDQSVHISAVQQAANDQVSSNQVSNDQVSIGAIVDGYPMLPHLDRNHDGRFTIRELRTLSAQVAEFDLDDDGRIESSEITAPIRLVFGLGPTAHLPLAQIRSFAATSITPSTDTPEWFVRMDRNGDQDLSRGEFPGTAEQFDQLDEDHDDLISPAEATRSESQTESAPTKSSTSPATPNH
ncbi:EF-hand domain-containing protein [Rubripirellula lacrimiformis]|uniref:hypothetical protein n=1 Tax=Rubripirellula lacrimiformis TaxID=1930273 RepID=UPI0011A350CB|nr:hypothetical protein [Rubripirellula lacrimiformis]